MVVRMALGDDVRPDLRAIPRATYTDPETASVGLQVEEAREAGVDAVEFEEDMASSAKGFTAETGGHVIVVVDRATRTVVGVFLAGPGASEAIHEAVLAVKLGPRLDTLADTIHAFPTLARVMGGVFIRAAQELAPDRCGSWSSENRPISGNPLVAPSGRCRAGAGEIAVGSRRPRCAAPICSWSPVTSKPGACPSSRVTRSLVT